MKRVLKVLMVLGFLVALTGCFNITLTLTGNSTGNASVKLINSSSTSIYYFYIAPSSSSSWGDDRLGLSVLSTGESHTVTGLPAGSWDLKVEGSGHSVISTRYNVQLSDYETYTWTIN